MNEKVNKLLLERKEAISKEFDEMKAELIKAEQFCIKAKSRMTELQGQYKEIDGLIKAMSPEEEKVEEK